MGHHRAMEIKTDGLASVYIGCRCPGEGVKNAYISARLWCTDTERKTDMERGEGGERRERERNCRDEKRLRVYIIYIYIIWKTKHLI